MRLIQAGRLNPLAAARHQGPLAALGGSVPVMGAGAMLHDGPPGPLRPAEPPAVPSAIGDDYSDSVLPLEAGAVASAGRHYLKKRGFGADAIGRYRMRVCANLRSRYFGRILIPCFDRADRLVYFTGRDFLGQEPRYLNPGEKESGIPRNHILFGENLAAGGAGRPGVVGICEGQFNAIRAAEASGLPFVAPLGKASEEQLDKLLALGATAFIVAYSYGAERQACGWGNALIKKPRSLAERLSGFGYGVRVVEFPDGRDFADLSLADCRRLIEGAKPF